MNRVDRLFAILLRLQGAGRLRASDLAAAFEVSQRTIYRDIRALGESGVPIVSLPGEMRRRAKSLTDIIAFFAPPERLDLDAPQLARLQQAIHNQQVVHLRYHSYSSDEVTERDVEPHQLHYSDGVWYVEGYCRLRQDVRSFRLSRIIDLSVRKETFQGRRPAKTAARSVPTGRAHGRPCSSKPLGCRGPSCPAPTPNSR